MKVILILLSGLIIFCTGCQKLEKGICDKDFSNLKMNEIQTFGSHNSYRLRTYQPIYDWAVTLVDIFNANYDPTEWDYNHLPLPEQFSTYHMRSVELDIYYDPQGGRFYNRQGNAFVGEDIASGVEELNQPGMKIIHIADLDYLTNYYTLVSALQTIKEWSDDHPTHLPITIMIELKTTSASDEAPGLGFTTALPFTSAALDSLDQEIISVFGEDLKQVITPDDVRGDFGTLKEAVLAGNWPQVKDACGKVIFVIQGGLDTYAENHPSFSGRPAFVFSNESRDDAAFLIYNDPIGSLETIKEAVGKGYMVRTRADANTKEARTGDETKLNAAIESGAQVISTDYYMADPRSDTSAEWSSYHAHFPNNEEAITNTGVDLKCLQ